MKNSEFYKIIKDNSIDDVFIGLWNIKVGDIEVSVDFWGSFTEPLYLVGGNEKEEWKEYHSLEEALSYKVNDVALKDQIENITDMILLESA